MHIILNNSCRIIVLIVIYTNKYAKTKQLLKKYLIFHYMHININMAGYLSIEKKFC